MPKTITEELAEATGGVRITRRIIGGHSCYLRLATYNKEEAKADLQVQRDKWQKENQFLKMTTMRTTSGKPVFLIWSCFR